MATLPVTQATPEGVASLLKTSRSLIVQAYFVYEFFAVGAAWSLLAVEASLNQRLNPPRSRTFAKLIDSASNQGILTDYQADSLHAGRRLRNDFAHPHQQHVLTPAAALPLIEVAHQVTMDLFPDTTTPSRL